MNSSNSEDKSFVTVIDSSAKFGWWKYLQEVWFYRDLFYFLVWRDLKTRYAQSVLGIGWAIIQPLFSMLVFTIVFGNMARISSDGVPYAIFSFAALVPRTVPHPLTKSLDLSALQQRMLDERSYH